MGNTVDEREKWRSLRNELHEIFRERQLTFAKAAERYELNLHEDDFDYIFNYERVKKFWKKIPKEGCSIKSLENDCPESSRLTAAVDYLERLRNYILDTQLTVIGKKSCESKRWIQHNMGIDFWNKFHDEVIKRVEDEENNEREK